MPCPYWENNDENEERERDGCQALECAPYATWGTGRIACATERQRRNRGQRRRPEASGTKGKSNRKRAGETPAVQKAGARCFVR